MAHIANFATFQYELWSKYAIPITNLSMQITSFGQLQECTVYKRLQKNKYLAIQKIPATAHNTT